MSSSRATFMIYVNGIYAGAYVAADECEAIAAYARAEGFATAAELASTRAEQLEVTSDPAPRPRLARGLDTVAMPGALG